MGRLVVFSFFLILFSSVSNIAFSADKIEAREDKKKVSQTDEIEKIKKQNVYLLEQKDKLQQALEREKGEHDQSVKELTAQKKLLIDEQRKIIEKLVVLRKSLANLGKECGSASERENLLAEELAKLTKEQEEFTQERLKGKEDRETLHSLFLAHKAFKKTFAEQQDRCSKVDEELKQCVQLRAEQSNQYLLEKNSNLALGEKIAASEMAVEKFRNELMQANDVIKALEIEKQNYNGLKQRYSDLEKSLIETRNALMLRETELKLLAESGSLAGQCNNSRNPSVINRQQRNLKQDSDRMGHLESAFVDQNVKNKQLSIKQSTVTIIQDEALLRSGPGNNYAPVLKVQKGSRFAVQSQQGDFYQVSTANGQGAYVHKDFVTIGSGSDISRVSPYRVDPIKPQPNAVPVGTFQDQSEDAQAFEAIRSGVKREP